MAHPSQASNHIYSAFVLFGVILLITQLPFHLRAERTGACLFIAWLSLSMLNSSINSIIWSNNTVNSAPGWCDISSYVIVASKYGVQLAPLCIARQLYHITTMKAVGRSRFEIRRDMFTNLFIGIGLSLLLLPLYYVIQGNRFMIVEQVGCYFVAIRTPPAFPLFAMWPPIFAFVSAVYSAFTFYGTIRRKSHMKEVMKSNEDLRSGKYWRLMALSGAQIVLILPSVIFTFVNDVAGGPMVPYTWDYIHAGFSEVSQVSISAWTFNLQNAIAFQWDRWVIIIYALLFFAFFGLSGEASQYYRNIFHVAMKLFGYRPSTPNSDILKASDGLTARKNVPRNPWSSLGSLRFMPFAHTSNETPSTNQLTSFPRVLSPPFCSSASLDIERGHSLPTNSGDAQPGPLKGTNPSNFCLRSLSCRENDAVFLDFIAKPEPAFGASPVLQHHSLDSRPVVIKAFQDSFVKATENC